MNLENYYYFFKSAIDPDTCKKIIDLGLAQMQSDKDLGINVEAYTDGNREKSSNPDAVPQGEHSKQQLLGQGLKKAYVRDSTVSWLNDQWIYDLFYPYIRMANKQAGWQWQWDNSEHFQFTVYEPGQFYSWHRDGFSDHHNVYKRYLYGQTPIPLSPKGNLPPGYTTNPSLVGKLRKISMTVNLNVPGDYDGGNLKFDFGQHTDGAQFYECEEIRPQGSIIIFPSFLDHCVTPVTSGTRYSLVLWCVGDPYK